MLARLGVTCTGIAAAVFVVQFSSDGYAHHAIADMWTHAPPEEQARLARATELLDVTLEGPGYAWIALLWGLPLVVFGTAMLLDPTWPTWLAWPAIVFGTTSGAVGIARFLQATAPPDGLIFAVATLGAAGWGITLGTTMWRRCSPLSARSSASRTTDQRARAPTPYPSGERPPVSAARPVQEQGLTPRQIPHRSNTCTTPAVLADVDTESEPATPRKRKRRPQVLS